MNFAVAAGRRLVFCGFRGRDAVAVTFAQAVGPGLVDAAFTIAGGCDHGFQCKMRRGEQLRLTAAIVDQFAGAVGDPDEARIRKDGRRAVADLVVELAPDQQDDVGVGHRGRADGRCSRRMIGRDKTAALLRVQIKRAGCIEQPHERGPGLPSRRVR